VLLHPSPQQEAENFAKDDNRQKLEFFFGQRTEEQGAIIKIT